MPAARPEPEPGQAESGRSAPLHGCEICCIIALVGLIALGGVSVRILLRLGRGRRDPADKSDRRRMRWRSRRRWVKRVKHVKHNAARLSVGYVDCNHALHALSIVSRAILDDPSGVAAVLGLTDAEFTVWRYGLWTALALLYRAQLWRGVAWFEPDHPLHT